jgi:hypothetical protein
MGEGLGLTGGEAEDLIEEYLDEMSNTPIASAAHAPKVHAPSKPVVAARPAPCLPRLPHRCDLPSLW